MTCDSPFNTKENQMKLLFLLLISTTSAMASNQMIKCHRLEGETVEIINMEIKEKVGIKIKGAWEHYEMWTGSYPTVTRSQGHFNGVSTPILWYGGFVSVDLDEKKFLIYKSTLMGQPNGQFQDGPQDFNCSGY